MLIQKIKFLLEMFTLACILKMESLLAIILKLPVTLGLYYEIVLRTLFRDLEVVTIQSEYQRQTWVLI